MTTNELREIILACCNDVVFTFNGKASGITSEVNDYMPAFQVWHGEEFKYYSDVDTLMSDPFYSGRSINELVSSIDFTIL